MAQCPKCGGEMRDGEVFVTFSLSSVDSSSAGLGMMGIPGTVFPSLQTMREEKLHWREKTGRKMGMILRSDEEKIMKVTGHRCIKCGYLELYVQEPS